jgi:hypothetical protein
MGRIARQLSEGGTPMSSIPARAAAAVAAATVLGLMPAAASASPKTASSVSVARVQALTHGKPLVSGKVNVIAVHPQFGFAVSVRNAARERRNVAVKVLVRYRGTNQAPLVLKKTGSVAPGANTVRLPARPRILFAVRASLTVSVSDRAHRTTAVRHYAVIFSLG